MSSMFFENETQGVSPGHYLRMGKGLKDKGKLPQEEIDQIAARLRLGRLALKLTSAELCRLADMKPNTYSQFETARGAPRLDQAKKLRRALGYTLDWIFEGDRSGLPLRVAQAIAEYEMGEESTDKTERKAS